MNGGTEKCGLRSGLIAMMASRVQVEPNLDLIGPGEGAFGLYDTLTDDHVSCQMFSHDSVGAPMD